MHAGKWPLLLHVPRMQITANETADALAAVEKFDKWFAAQLTAQEALSNLETPILTRDMVTTRVKPITVRAAATTLCPYLHT